MNGVSGTEEKSWFVTQSDKHEKRMSTQTRMKTTGKKLEEEPYDLRSDRFAVSFIQSHFLDVCVSRLVSHVCRWV